MVRSSSRLPDDPAPTDALTEGRLLVRHREGEAEAFAELVARYRAPVFGYLVRCGVEPAARDDLFQDIFLSVHNAAGSYQPERPLHPWVFTIVANAVRNHRRRMRVRRLVFPASAPEEAPAADPDGYQQAEARETAGWLEQAMDRLPLAQREVLVLCAVQRLDQQEAAEILRIPVNTLKTRLRRARLTLARALARRNAAAVREEPS